MDIRTILVNFDVDSFSPTLVKCAGDLAHRFKADIIGVAAAEPPLMTAGADGGVASSALYAELRQDIENRLDAMKKEFAAAIRPDVKSSWLGYAADTNRCIITLARRADLIVTGAGLAGNDHFLPALDLGQVVFGSGRPVLAVGSDTAEIKVDKIVIGWKDTREARRAVADAMPFLRKAGEVVVAIVDEGDNAAEKQGLNDVLAWIASHGVKVRGDVYPNQNGLAATLNAVRREIGADLVVSGAFGRSRLREWLFGGMTRDLLAATSFSRFIAN